MIFTVSMKRLWDRCPRAHHYRVDMKLDSPNPSLVLQRGAEFHSDMESLYGGNEDDVTSKNQAYVSWSRRFDDLKITSPEEPVLVPITELYKYAYPGIRTSHLDEVVRTRKDWGGNVNWYGGVIDGIATDQQGNRWVIDHKTVKNFYPVHELYTLEQLGMYLVATDILGDTYAGSTYKGAILSRVKIIRAHYQHYMNYLKKYLSKYNCDINKKILSDIYKQVLKNNKEYNKKSNKSIRTEINTTSNNSNITSNNKSNTITVNVRAAAALLKVTTNFYKTGGGLVDSIYWESNTLVHVQRSYFTPEPYELQEIVKDFLSYVELYIDHHPAYRRSPGLHCNYCTYADLCWDQRRTVGSHEWDEPDEKYGLVHRPPAEEVLKRVQEEGVDTEFQNGV